MKLTMIVSDIHLLGDKVEKIFVAKKFLRAVAPRFMQIVTSVEQFGDLKNMSVGEVIGYLKVHEESFWGYEDKEEEKYLLLTHEQWLTRTKKKDVVDFSFSGTRGRDNSPDKENKDCGRDRVHGHRLGGRGDQDNTSQIHDHSNP